MRSILDFYKQTRAYSLQLCERLCVEDMVVQPYEHVSPIRWHLAHTTWFIEKICLEKSIKGYQMFRSEYDYLFNSYYESFGKKNPRCERGAVSRPTVQEIYDYRSEVDRLITELLNAPQPDETLQKNIYIALHHEKQHQELMLQDIKAISRLNRIHFSTFQESELQCEALTDFEIKAGIYEFGYDGTGFSYDSERPRHKIYLGSSTVSGRLISNGEYLEFIEAGGYSNFRFWLNDGWSWVNEQQIESPLYWRKDKSQYEEFYLDGWKPLNLAAPVRHVSFYEASAFALWKGVRLPYEQEMELFIEHYNIQFQDVSDSNLVGSRTTKNHQFLWQWTDSNFRPYPGFKPENGALLEYNSKFMASQFVLRGGSYASSGQHLRSTYRNFYYPQERWMYSGVRLAYDH